MIVNNERDGGLEELRIYLLGCFRVYIGAREIDQEAWRRRKAQSLVKLLALTPGHRLHKEQLIDFLWPDLDPTAADNNLRQVLFLTRKLFDQAGLPGLNVLRLSESWIELYPEGNLQVDVELFERAGTDARRMKTTESYRAALALYPGDLLPDDRYEEWASTRRENLRALHQQLLLDTARHYQSSQEYKNAIECFLKLIEIEPADEESHLALMRIYAQVGWRSQAIRQFHNLQKILRSELDVEPDPTSLELYEAILTNRFPGKEHQTVHPIPTVLDLTKHNLPSHWTSFIGRELEISEIGSFLTHGNDSSENRLLTILGPGGSGKTRLAIEIAHRLETHFPEGAWFVDLSGTANGEFVPHVVATTLGIREESQSSIDITLVNSLRSRCLLMVLDNCEHLIEACSSLAYQLLSNCSKVHILATSRQTLGLRGEAVRRLGGLPIMEDASRLSTLSSLEDSKAVQLFVERARLHQPNFHLDENNIQAVSEICRRLDGLPLAIELAAARMNILSPTQIADRLNDRFRLLLSRNREIVERHRSLHTVIDWSCNLLSPLERYLFERLSVFRGSWSLDAVEAVTAGNGLLSEDLLDLLSALVDKSLVQSVISQSGEIRYRTLETIREYARERLMATGEAETYLHRHVDYFVSLVEQAEPKLRSVEQLTWFHRLDIEYENLQAALGWASVSASETGLRLAGALWYYWFIRAYWAEGRLWLEKVIAAPSGDSPNYQARKAFALACLAFLLIYIGEIQIAQDVLEESLKLCEGFKEPNILAFAIKQKEYIHRLMGNYQSAEIFAKQSVEIYRGIGQTWGVAWGLYCLGIIEQVYKHDTTEAYRYYSESLNLYRESGDRRGCAYALNNLGNIAVDSGDFKMAVINYQESLSLSIELGDRLGVSLWLCNLGICELALGNFSQAKQYLLEGISVSTAIGYERGTASALLLLGEVIRIEGDLEQANKKYEESLIISRRLNDWSLIGCALNGIGNIELTQGHLSAAEDYQRQALAVLQQAPNRYGDIPSTFESLAAVMLARKRGERAVKLYGAAQALRCSLPLARMSFEQKEFEENLAKLQLLLSEAAYVAAWEEGLTMNTDQAIQFALNHEITEK